MQIIPDCDHPVPTCPAPVLLLLLYGAVRAGAVVPAARPGGGGGAPGAARVPVQVGAGAVGEVGPVPPREHAAPAHTGDIAATREQRAGGTLHSPA